METEAEAIACAARRIDDQFLAAVRLIEEHTGKIVVTGLGKSGFVAQKLAATMCSTGTPAVFLHPVDALHGDVGIYAAGRSNNYFVEERNDDGIAAVDTGFTGPEFAADRNHRQHGVAFGARNGHPAGRFSTS